MKKFNSNILWGIGLILIGLLLTGKAIGLYEVNIFFRGWWTLIIMIPCFINLLQDRDKTGSLIGLVLGIVLLSMQQDLISWHIISKLFIPVIMIWVGVHFLFRDRLHKHNYNQNSNSSNKDTYYYSEDSSDSYSSSYQQSNMQSDMVKNPRNMPGFYNCTSVMNGRILRVQDEEFKGANLTAILGGIDLDLRNAIINSDVTIDLFAVAGGIDIYVPNNVRVVVDCSSILGGIDNNVLPPTDSNVATIFISGSCILGGVDVK